MGWPPGNFSFREWWVTLRAQVNMVGQLSRAHVIGELEKIPQGLSEVFVTVKKGLCDDYNFIELELIPKCEKHDVYQYKTKLDDDYNVKIVYPELDLDTYAFKQDTLAKSRETTKNHFSIAWAPEPPSIEILSPISGDVVLAGQVLQITWTTPATVAADALLTLFVTAVDNSQDGECAAAEATVFDVPNGPGVYDWSVPVDIPPGEYRLRLVAIKLGVEVKSDSFVIEAAAPSVVLPSTTPTVLPSPSPTLL